MKVKIAGFVLFVMSVAVWSQAKGVVLSAEGKDFVVIRGGIQEKVQDPVGYGLNEGDILQTGKKTVVEISIFSAGAQIKIAENTSFAIRKSTVQGKDEFELMYGRVRSKVKTLTGGKKMEIRSQGAIASVRGNDFAYDVIIQDKSPQPLSRVACFEGAMEVTSYKPALDGKAKGEQLSPIPETILLKAGTMTVVPFDANRPPLKAVPISDEVIAFWNTVSGKKKEPVVEAEVRPIPPPIVLPKETTGFRDVAETKNGLSGGALFMAVFSAGCATGGLIMNLTGAGEPYAPIATGVGIGAAALGAVFTIISIAVNP